MRARWSACLPVFVAVLVGCGSEGRDVASNSGKLSACDPFAAYMKPVTLEGVIAAGKAADGTIYVVTAGSKTEGQRVFVSAGETLVRRRVLGSGSSGSGQWTISFEDSMPSRLVFDVDNRTVTKMGLVHDAERTFIDDLNGDFLPLTILSTDALKDLQVQGLDGTIQLEHMAHTDDGRRIVVTRPTDDWSYDDFRVFMGVGEQLDECTLDNASRGSSTWLTFTCGSTQYDAVFASPQLAPNQRSMITETDESFPVMLDDVTKGVPAGTTFNCLK